MPVSEDDCSSIGLNFRQIRATKTFTTSNGATVEAGTLGGWLSMDTILDQNGNCWVDETSRCVNSIIMGDALISNDSKTFGGKYLGDNILDNSKAVEHCYLKNVKAKNSRMSHVNTYNGASDAHIIIFNSRVSDFKLVHGARNITISGLGETYYHGWENIPLVDNTNITSADAFAEVLLGRKLYAIYPVGDSVGRKIVISENDKFLSDAPDELKSVYERVCKAVKSHSATSETSFFD